VSRSRSITRKVSDYRRGKPRNVLSGKIILIVTEGKKTEPNYLKALRKRFQLSATDIEIIHPEGTDPVTLTNRAVELRNQRKNKIRSGAIPYDEVWVVFDLEKTHDERRAQAITAMSIPEAKGIRFAVSDPAFEYWLLLHEEYTTASFADCDAVTARLKSCWPDYKKGSTPSAAFLDKVPTAVKNAKQVRIDNEKSGRTNPATDVDWLVCSMNESTRQHLQYKLSNRH
jgi:uncharacterized protein YnzC (UPF0291/DUF896 family)